MAPMISGVTRCICWVALATASLSGCSLLNSDHGGVGALLSEVPDDAVVYAAMADPDDEFQAWSVLEDSGHFTVIVAMTRGEITERCSPEGFLSGWQEGLEIAPDIIPTAMEDETCVEARMASIRGFPGQM